VTSTGTLLRRNRDFRWLIVASVAPDGVPPLPAA